MGLRFSFELFYPAGRVADALAALRPYSPAFYRKRRGQLVRVPENTDPPDLSGLTPDAPLFFDTSLLFPAEDDVRAWFGVGWDERIEWDDEGNEHLPVGSINVTVRTGTEYALLSYAACTSGMSRLFEGSRTIWRQFDTMLRASGGLTAIFSGWVPSRPARYPVLPDGAASVELDFFDYVLEERDMYWHLDVDRYAADVLRAAGHSL